MRTKSNWLKLFTALTVLALVLAAAGCAKATPLPEPTKLPEAKPTATEPPAKPTDTPKPVGPKRGGTIVFVIPEDPPSFNAYVNDTGYEELAAEMMNLGLAEIAPDGTYYPELATELPTVENGGVVLDEEEETMTVTWHLHEGVRWEDGTPVTSADVKFTWEAITDEEGGVWWPGMELITDIETPDDYTVILHYDSIYPGYLTQFGGEGTGIFPKHHCKTTDNFTTWECNHDPLSNGPFILEEWVTGDHLTFVRNPDYFEEGKPYLDKIIVKIVPDESVRKTMMEAGDAHLDMWIVESFIDELAGSPTVDVNFAETGRWLMRLIPNLSEKGSADPEKPHPVLSDVRVRQAIRMAIDVDLISKEIFGGHATPTWTEFFRPPYQCDIPKPKYDPEAAKALLEEAGWTDTDGDGIRECHGCGTAEDGYVMRIENVIYAEYGEELELAQQLIADQLKAIGLDLELRMEEGGIIWAEWVDGGIEATGNFDLDMWDDGWTGVDPTDFLWDYYYSEAIPTEEEPGAGTNVMRWANEDFDALLDEAYTLDEETRKEIFCNIAKILDEELPMIYLFVVPDAAAVSKKLKGVHVQVNDTITWNAADWYLQE